MGCGQSSRATGDGAASRSTSYTQIINDKCPHIRLDAIKTLKNLKVEGSNYSYNLDYVYVSQRGYYPNGKHSKIFSFCD